MKCGLLWCLSLQMAIETWTKTTSAATPLVGLAICAEAGRRDTPAVEKMHPLVRDLYKRILTVGKEYPNGLDWVKSKAKPWIMQNKDITDEIGIRKKVAEGRFWVREMKSVISLKKYRAMKNRYYG
mmetsp:Transcript_4088/g.7172  ORF Transcript_4088/g.7172 Transcript_4088/m.7172 type:complete len:126 (+) Transcript_4088:28-405(+)